MPDEAAMPKLTPEAQERVLQWLCEGFRNSEVLEKLQGEFDIPLTRQGIDYYRDKWDKEIQEAQDEAERRAKQQGLSNRLRRISLLETLAAKLGDAAIEESPRNSKDLSPEVRALLRDIRDEFGDLKTRQEHTGAGGGPIEVDINGAARDKLADTIAGLSARLDKDGGAGGDD